MARPRLACSRFVGELAGPAVSPPVVSADSFRSLDAEHAGLEPGVVGITGRARGARWLRESAARDARQHRRSVRRHTDGHVYGELSSIV